MDNKGILEKYGFAIEDEEIASRLDGIASGISGMESEAVLKKCFSLMDLTTLHTNDTEESVRKLVGKVNDLPEKFPTYPLPASICVYPNFASVVASARNDASVHVTTVSGCFPSSQSFLEVKARECELAVENGADEIDIVLALNAFMTGDLDRAAEEIRVMRSAVDAAGARSGRKVVLKVILETGLLRTAENIAAASFLAMENGADFIKTSTGKVDVNATPMAALVMCRCIGRFHEVTGKKIGFKAAGGISSAKDALCYYAIVSSELGQEWICPDLFRFGVSRLGNALMSEIEHSTVTFF